MTDSVQPENAEDALSEAHRQLVDRDQRIRDLELETVALRSNLEAILRSRAWRAAERYRRVRALVLRR